MDNIHFHVMRASGRLESFIEIIDDVKQNYLPGVVNELDAADVDVVVCVDPSRAIPETGVGGWAYNANLIAIFIDPDSKGLGERFDFELRSTLAHEFNHATRWRNVGYKYALLDSIISDGLADHFDVAINGGAPRPWDMALSEEDLKTYLDQAKLVWADENYNHARWYFGTEDIPRWAGYSLGFKLVGDYINKTGERNFRILTRLPAEAFVQ